MSEMIWKLLIVYAGIVSIGIIFMICDVSMTPWNLKPQFTPRQTWLGPFIWPWFLFLGVVWWFKHSYIMLCSLIKSIKTNEWQ